MFTGIIEATGSVRRLQPLGGDLRFVIDGGALDMSDVRTGDSIAVNGVCLTAVQHDADSFTADVSNETIALTTLKNLKAGSPVNLEKAMLPTTRMGGHLVSGHVDGLGTVLDTGKDARSIRLRIEVPRELTKYIAHKGSICIDGVSLTVNSIDGCIMGLNIVPHTQQRTVIQHYRSGDQVNLEVDVIARYLERLLLDRNDNGKGGISRTLLAESGFIK